MKMPEMSDNPRLPRTPVRSRRTLLPFLTVMAILGLPASGLSAQSILLETFNLSGKEGTGVRLPRALEEISGLAMTPDGRLFAHDDERAVFYELDMDTGGILKTFSAGIGGVAGDFEGIAVVGERFFLSTSMGEILETAEGRPSSSMSFRVHETGLGSRCELEGLAYDPRAGTLLLPCKEPRVKKLEGHVVVFSVALSTMRPLLVPRVFTPLGRLEDFHLKDEFYPSGIEIHPGTGNILIISAREEAILELSSQGTLLGGQELPRRAHPHPEGITFAPDGSLLLADEGQRGRARLTRYPPVKMKARGFLP